MPPSAHPLRCRFVALVLVVLFPAAGVAADPPDLLTSIDAALKDNRLMQTRSTDSGKDSFTETTKKPGYLVGFELGLGRFGKIEVIYALRPIYRNADGEWFGPSHGLFPQAMKDGKVLRSEVTRMVKGEARPGYAVSGMTVRTGLYINGLSLRFQRLEGNHLNPRDTYDSEWIGDRTGGQENTLDSKGMVIVGIHGRDGDRACQSLGLIFLEPVALMAANLSADKEPARAPAVDPDNAPIPSSDPLKVRAPGVDPDNAPIPSPDPLPIKSDQGSPLLKSEPKKEAVKEKSGEVQRTLLAQAAKPAVPDKGGLGSLLLVVGVLVTTLLGGALFLVFHYQTPAATKRSASDPSRPTLVLPEELQARVRQELTADEQVLWAGQPSPRVTRLLGLQAAGAYLFMTLLSGLLLLGFLATATHIHGGAWIIPGVMGLFVLLGLGGMVLAPWQQARKARRTWYVLTNRRALVGLPGVFGETAVDSYTPLQLQNMNRRDSWFARGAGDLVFRTERRVVVRTATGRYGSSSVSERIIRYGFLGVEDVAAVDRMVRQTLVDPMVDKFVR